MEKQMIKKVTSRFHYVAAGIGVAISLFMSLSARAQNPAAATTPPTAPVVAETERVIVTGSNIPTAEEVTAAPVDTLNTQEMNRSGSQEVLTILQKRNPSFTGAGNLGT